MKRWFVTRGWENAKEYACQIPEGSWVKILAALCNAGASPRRNAFMIALAQTRHYVNGFGTTLSEELT
ncbi:hypothetical protein VTO42DRAFT_355 [Malbranchea cinnamomea]